MELFIIRDGQQTGPFSEETVQGLLEKGGLRGEDMGWHKGLPAWLPLAEVFRPGSQRPAEPPPVSNTAASGIRPRSASARQKALLQYLGVPFSEKTTREEAAVVISDALENPKLTSRLARWGEEKLRLHPDIFQEEIDYRRANRISRYLELCQTDGAEVVKDITKAHVQVLMESLDKRQVGWDQEPRSALWDYLLPSVAEHFPQLVQEEWRGKLRYGGTSKVAAAYAGIPATGVLVPHAPAQPGPLRAAARGVVYGLLALGAVIGGTYFFRDQGKSDIARNDQATAAPAPGANTPAIATAPPGEAPAPALHPTDVPLIGADPNNAVAAATPVPAPAPNAPAETPAPAPTPAAPAAPTEAPATPGAPMMNNTTAFTPAPPPPGSEPLAIPPAAPAGSPAAGGPVMRNSATLTQAVTVQLQFGKVTLNPGTRLRLIALEGANARVNFNNNIVLIPVASTDIDPANTVVAAQPLVPTPLPATALPPTAIPATAPTASAPASSLAPKPLPSSDL